MPNLILIESHVIQNVKLKNSNLITLNNHSKNKTKLFKSSNPKLQNRKFSERKKKNYLFQ